MDKNYQDLFFSEAEEYLQEVSKALVFLEENLEDREAINTIFRHMHTLKGMAATIGYMDLAKLAHRLEDVFSIIRSGTTSLSEKNINIIFESIDALGVLINDLKKNTPPSTDVLTYLNKLDTLLPSKQKSEEKQPVPKREITVDESLLDTLKKDGKNVFRIVITLIQDCPMKSARAFLIIQYLRRVGELIAISPEENDLKKDNFDGSFECVIATKEKQEVIHSELLTVREIDKVTLSIFETAPTPKTSVKPKPLAPLPAIRNKIQGIRISTDKLDRVMNLIGELVIAKNRFSQTVRNKDYLNLTETCYFLEQLVSLLQDEVLKMRLLPISHITDNFHRFVRDTAKAIGKDIALNISGSEVELDRVILDELGDLLMHLIKNSIDHGIEPSDERVRCGKDPKGTILIKIFREKGYVAILIQDDGKGIDQNLVIKKALEKHLISQQEAENFSLEHITDILTAPGFSTKEEVTELSGRGVGLDVVKNRLNSLGGTLKLETEKGKGTLFSITLPLSLAIIKAMLVLCGKETYAIPLMSVRETIQIRKKDIKPVGKGNIMLIRNEVIPFLDLDNLLNFKELPQNNSENILVVITERSNKSVGFAVDKIIGEQDIVVKPLGSFFKGIKMKGITGATILGNGRVALILDMLNIVDLNSLS